MLTGLAENTSTWAAWQSGMRGVTFGGQPAGNALRPAGAVGYPGRQRRAGHGAQHRQAHTDSQAHTDGTAHTTGTADSSGWSHMVGNSVSQSEGVSASQSQAHSTGQAVSNGTATTDSSGQVNSQGTGVSHSDSFNWGLRGGIQPGGVGIGANVGWGSADTTSNMASQSNMTGHSDTSSHFCH